MKKIAFGMISLIGCIFLNFNFVDTYAYAETSVTAESMPVTEPEPAPLSEEPEIIVLESISLDQPTLSLTVGTNTQLAVGYSPTDTTDDRNVVWTSNDSSVAAVDATGNVTAIGSGTAIITANVGGETAVSEVTITESEPAPLAEEPEIIALESISLDQPTLSLTVGTNAQLTVGYSPADTTDARNVVWTSNDSNVAAVDATGNVTAIGSGTAIITANVGDKAAASEVTVTELEPALIPEEPAVIALESIILDQATLSLSVGTNAQLVVGYSPSDTTDDRTVAWSSSDSGVAVVDAMGNVTAIGVGIATITAIVGDKAAASEVTVTEEASIQAKITVASSTAKLLFTFDDGAKETITIAAPILAEKGFEGTAFVGENIETQYWASSGMMDDADLEELYSTFGWDLGNHSANHKWLGNRKDAATIFAFQQDYLANQNWLLSNGWTRGAYHLAYTGGSHNAELIESLKAIGVKTARTTIYDLETIPIEDYYRLKTINVNYGLAYVKEQIDEAVSTGSTIILMFHGINETAAQYVISTADFQAIVDYASQYSNQGSLGVMTVSEWYSAVAGPEESIPLESISLDQTAFELTVGGSQTLVVSYNPTNTTDDKTVGWSSSNNAVATVDGSGNVTAISAGAATITANVGGKTATSEVTVAAEVVPLESISLDQTAFDLKAGASKNLVVSYNPTNTTDDKTVSWSSSNNAVATVDAAGNVTAISVGTATITANVGGKTASSTVTVTEISGLTAQLMFTFDDGAREHLIIAAPILAEKGFEGTAYVGENIEAQYWSAAGKMTEADLEELYSTYGWDLANHSANHRWLGNRTDAATILAFQQDYLANQNWLLANGWTRGAYQVAYAGGSYNDQLIESLKAIGVQTARTSQYGVITNPISDYYKLKTINVLYGLDYVKRQIDEAVRTGSSVILMIHGINETAAQYVTSTADFQAIVDYASQYSNQGSLGVMTVSEWYSAVAGPEESIPLESISLDQTAFELTVGGSQTLVVSYNPTNTTDDKTVGWSSSNNAVATVDGSGNVTAISAGAATITANVGGKTATSEVTVAAEVVPLESISLDQTAFDLKAGASKNLVVSYNPTNTTDDKTVSWSSSNNAVATVDAAGNVTAISVGTATITANVGGKTASSTVTVTEISGLTAQLMFTFDDGAREHLIIAAPILAEKGFEGTAYVGENIEAQYWSAAGKMTEADLEELYSTYGWDLANHSANHRWLGNRTDAATILAFQQDYLANQNWLLANGWTRGAYQVAYAGGSYNDQLIESLKAIGVQTARTSQYGVITNPISDYYKLKTINVLYGLDYVKRQIDEAVRTGSSVILMIHGINETAAQYVTSIADFQAIVDYASQYSNQGSLNVTTVSEWYQSLAGPEESIPLESISLDQTAFELTVGGSQTLVVSYNPTNTTDDKTVGWSSSNNAVATVDGSGNVTAISAGAATITANVGGKMATSEVTVAAEVVPLESISLDQTAFELTVGGSQTLVVSYNPTNTTDDKTVGWSSSNNAVATVDGAGNVTAISAGAAAITANVGGKTATSEVTVAAEVVPLESISLDQTAFELTTGSSQTLVVSYNPTNTTDDKTVGWSSSNNAVATVDAVGNVTAISVGTSTITANVGGKTATSEVTVGEAIWLPPTMIMFDDGSESVYTEAFPALTERGIAGSFFVVTDSIGTEGYVTWEQLEEMQAAGWTIGNHTSNHIDLVNSSRSDAIAAVADGAEALSDRGFIGSTYLAAPYNSMNSRVESYIANLVTLIRIGGNSDGISKNIISSDNNKLRARSILRGDSPEEVFVNDYAYNIERDWAVCLNFHNIGYSDDDDYFYTIENFETLLDMVIEDGASFYTVDQYVKEYIDVQ